MALLWKVSVILPPQKKQHDEKRNEWSLRKARKRFKIETVDETDPDGTGDNDRSSGVNITRGIKESRTLRLQRFFASVAFWKSSGLVYCSLSIPRRLFQKTLRWRGYLATPRLAGYLALILFPNLVSFSRHMCLRTMTHCRECDCCLLLILWSLQPLCVNDCLNAAAVLSGAAFLLLWCYS